MTIQLNEIRECFDDRTEARKLANHPVSADEAYARLKAVRKMKDDFGDEINKYVRTIPHITRVKYERLFESIEELISEECYNVENGD